MPSKVEVANAALTLLGADTVTALDQANDQARTINARFDAVRDSVLRAHPWNFALRRALLPAETAAPAWGFARQYRLPTDPYCLRVLRLEDTSATWKVEGRKLLTDGAAPLRISYIARIADTMEWDALFAEAFAARLAAAIGKRLSSSARLQKDAWDLYAALIREARSIDAQEGTPEELGDGEFLEARL